MQQYAPRESGAPQGSPREAFAPLPLRARGTLELLDASIKLYRQYFGVLLAWSAIVSSASVLGAFLPGGGLLGLFLTPMLVGAIICCVAASVRGQRVSFGQCWDFTKPRYGPLIGAYLLSLLVVIGLVFLFVIAYALVVFGMASFFSETGGAVGIVAILVLLAFSIVAFTRLTIWMGMVPVVVAMEEDKRSNSALSRANELLKGQYGRITGLMVLLGLGYLVLAGIMMGVVGLVTGADHMRSLANGRTDSTAILAAIAGVGTSFTLLSMLTTPLFYLIIALFYLDVRVRKEALDLEWSAHATAPVAPEAPQGFQAYAQPAPGFTSPPNTVQGPSPETTYAPNPAYPPPAAPYAPPSQYPTAAPYRSAPIETPPFNTAPTEPPYSTDPTTTTTPPPQEMPAPFAAPETSAPAASMPAPFALDVPPPFPSQPFEVNAAAPPFVEPAPIETSFAPPIAPVDFAPQAQPAPETDVTCANCGAKAPRGQRFCMQCGSNLPVA